MEGLAEYWRINGNYIGSVYVSLRFNLFSLALQTFPVTLSKNTFSVGT